MFKIFKDQESISLGLSICKEIAQKYDGTITFESEFKVGSKFKLEFTLEEFDERVDLAYFNSVTLDSFICSSAPKASEESTSPDGIKKSELKKDLNLNNKQKAEHQKDFSLKKEQVRV